MDQESKARQIAERRDFDEQWAAEQALIRERRAEPEQYVRINISKTAKEYRAETTISLRWTGRPEDGTAELRHLLRLADDLAREEIERREYQDRLIAAGEDR